MSYYNKLYSEYLRQRAEIEALEKKRRERHLNPDIAEFFFHSVRELNKLDTTLQKPFS